VPMPSISASSGMAGPVSSVPTMPTASPATGSTIP
jgi:hypothetical protein